MKSDHTMELAILFIGLLLVITYFIWNHLTLRRKLEGIEGPKSLPFIGLAWEIRNINPEDRLKWFNDLCYKFKSGLVVTWLATEPVVTIRKPHLMEVILPNNNNITKTRMYEVMKAWLGNGLLTSTGESWFKQRRLITPAFHFGVLEEYAVVMSEKVLILNECIKTYVQENPGKAVNIFDLTIKYTLDTICQTAMGVNIDAQRKTDTAYVKALHKFAQLSTERLFQPLLKWDTIYYRTKNGKEFLNAVKIMHEFTEKVIRDKQLERKNKKTENTEFDEYDEFGKRKRKAFLDLLLDSSESDKNPLTLKEIREEVDTFMFAGHDTTAVAISWALFALGNEPKIQAKVHEELKETFSDSDEPATTKQLGQLKYLDRVIKEVLRMYPSAPSVSRCLDNDIVFDNHVVPKGTVVGINIYQLHHDPEVWNDPETFDPDRFLPENSHERHTYAYVPFSAGPRNCIGQKFALIELKTVLTSILRKWRVRSILKPSEMKMEINFTLRPANDKIEIHFEPINNSYS